RDRAVAEHGRDRRRRAPAVPFDPPFRRAADPGAERAPAGCARTVPQGPGRRPPPRLRALARVSPARNIPPPALFTGRRGLTPPDPATGSPEKEPLGRLRKARY